MKFSFNVALLLLLTFSSATRSNTFLLETHTGVINVHQSLNRTITETGTYLLHTTEQTTPLTLVFRDGTPDRPVLTGDKVQVVGLNTAGKFFVQRIKSLPNSSLPF